MLPQTDKMFNVKCFLFQIGVWLIFCIYWYPSLFTNNLWSANLKKSMLILAYIKYNQQGKSSRNKNIKPPKIKYLSQFISVFSTRDNILLPTQHTHTSDIQQCLKTFFYCQDRKNTTGIWRVETGVLINLPQCAGWPPQQKNIPSKMSVMLMWRTFGYFKSGSLLIWHKSSVVVLLLMLSALLALKVCVFITENEFDSFT